MFRRLMFIGCVLGFSTTLFGEVNPDTLPEKYVKKVIIEAKWGSGPGEFGMDTLSDPPGGPGNLLVDEDENIFIYDCANGRIYKYDFQGLFMRELNVRKEHINEFTVKNDTIYAVIFTGLSPVEKVKTIDVTTGQVIKTLNINLPESDRVLEIENEGGNIIISRGEKEKYEIEGFENSSKNVQAKITRIPELLQQGTFKKLTQNKGEFRINGHKFITSNVHGGTLLSAKLLGKDRDGNFYIEVWEEAPLKSNSYRLFDDVLKYSLTGKLLACIEIPLDEMVGEGIGKNPQIVPNGDIYYLYPTGKWQERGDWKPPKFIPGKIQVIKWELQK